MTCISCWGEASEGNALISPCECRGSVGWVHEACHQQWVTTSGHTTCVACLATYIVGEPTPLDLLKRTFAANTRRRTETERIARAEFDRVMLRLQVEHETEWAEIWNADQARNVVVAEVVHQERLVEPTPSLLWTFGIVFPAAFFIAAYASAFVHAYFGYQVDKTVVITLMACTACAARFLVNVYNMSLEDKVMVMFVLGFGIAYNPELADVGMAFRNLTACWQPYKT